MQGDICILWSEQLEANDNSALAYQLCCKEGMGPNSTGRRRRRRTRGQC